VRALISVVGTQGRKPRDRGVDRAARTASEVAMQVGVTTLHRAVRH